MLLVEIKGIDDHFVKVLSNYCEKVVSFSLKLIQIYNY